MKNFFFILVCPCLLFCQSETITKVGGCVFRVDDNHYIWEFTDYAKIFDRYFFKCCLAINPGLTSSLSFYETLRALQANGHEILDHTPNHQTKYFSVFDTSLYSGKKGVDHISNDLICLKVESVNTGTYSGEGLINVSGNLVTSLLPGEFKYLFTKPNGNESMHVILLPQINRLFHVVNLFNKNDQDIDSCIIESFWGEQVNLNFLKDMQYEKIGLDDVHMDKDGIELLGSYSKQLFQKYSLIEPKVYIAPGYYPFLSIADIKNVYGNRLNYICGGNAGLSNVALKCYNEYNPQNDRQFGLQWGDFQETSTTFSELKKIIADRKARHYFSIGASHFSTSNLLGGWNGYLARMDSLLSWCAQKNIPVVTYSEMAQKLYYAKSNPYENVFPRLNVDLDEDGYPDGYNSGVGFIDTTDGVVQSSNRSFTISKNGVIAEVMSLGGLEKGDNDFIIYTKGSIGDSIRVVFQYEGNQSSNLMFILPANSEHWQKYSLSGLNTSISVPDNINTCNIIISTASYSSGAIKVSGMEMRKKSFSSVLPPFLLEPIFNNSGISLIWVNNESNNPTKIKIQRKKEGDNNFADITTIDNGTSYFDSSVLSNQTYYYRLQAFTTSNLTSEYSDTVKVITMVTDVRKNSDLPNKFTLYQNYPNPLNPNTLISWRMAVDSNVINRLYDILGREFTTLVDEYQSEGNHNLTFNMKNYALTSGIYFYQIRAVPSTGSGETFVQTKKMVLLK